MASEETRRATAPDGGRRRGPGPAEPTREEVDRAFARAENEDDDGYDPWSDRRPEPEPLFERDPWD